MSSVLLIITFLLFGLGQFGRVQLFDRPIFILAYEPVLVIWFLIQTTYHMKTQKLTAVKRFFSRLHRDKHEKKINGEIFNMFRKYISPSIGLFLSYMGIVLIVSSFFYPISENIIAWLYYLRLGFYLLLLILFLNIRPPKIYKLVIHVLTIWTVFISYFQFYFYQNFTNLAYLGWDPHLYRLVGVFPDPPVAVSVFGLLLIFYTLRESRSTFQWVVCGLLLGCILLTYSRGGYLALIITGIIYFIRNRVYWNRFFNFTIPAIVPHHRAGQSGGRDSTLLKGATLSAAVIMSIFAFSHLSTFRSEGTNLFRTASIGARMSDYAEGIRVWKKSPIFGIGYNHIRAEKTWAHESTLHKYDPSHAAGSFHSSFMIVLVTGGIIGLLLMLYMLSNIVKLGEFSFYSIVFLSVLSLFDNVLLQPIVLFLFGFLSMCQKKKLNNFSHVLF